jgi:hypothetical protein
MTLGQPVMLEEEKIRKKRVTPLSPILQKTHNFREYFRFKIKVLIASKHLKVFSETKVFSKYFKNTLMANGA